MHGQCIRSLASPLTGITIGFPMVNMASHWRCQQQGPLAMHMIRFGVALPALLLFAATLAATQARADCHWAWHCDRAAGCGVVPFCDTPNDKPPPLRGARLPGDISPAPLPPNAYAARKPLPGFKPINPPPPGWTRTNSAVQKQNVLVDGQTRPNEAGEPVKPTAEATTPSPP
jgi:hypothetical protein